MDIYLVCTTKTYFESAYDWVSVSTSDRVFSGTVNFVANEWTNIVLDENFYYNGTENVVLVVDDNSGVYESGNVFKVFSANNQSISISSNNTNYDPLNPSGVVTLKNVKNQIRIQKIAVGCARPANLTVSFIGARSATFTWDASDGDSFEYGYAPYDTPSSEYNPVYNANTGTATLENLDPETDYVFYVRKNCGDGSHSNYATVNFTTNISCQVPSYFTVLNTEKTCATLSWQKDEAEAWQILYNDVEDHIVNITTSDVTVNDNTVIYRLTNLVPEISYNAKVRACCSENDQSSWSEMVIFKTSNTFTIGAYSTQFNYVPTYSYYNYSLTQQIYTKEELGDAGIIDCIDFYCFNGMTRNLEIYMIETTKTEFTGPYDWIIATADNLVFSGSVDFQEDEWTSIVLDEYFVYSGDYNVVIVVDDNTGYYISPKLFAAYTVSSNQTLFYYNDGNNPNPLESNYNRQGICHDTKNQIRIYKEDINSCYRPRLLQVNNVTGHSASLSWDGYNDSYDVKYRAVSDGDWITAATNITETTIELEDLTPNTGYVVHIIGNCGNDEHSNAASINFTTVEACPRPTNLRASAIYSTGATITWNGVGDSYDLEYAKYEGNPHSLIPYHFSFDDDTFQGWTTIDADGDPYNWIVGSENSTGTVAYNNTGSCVLSHSWIDNDALDPDNYLVSPRIVLGGSISFYAKAERQSYPFETFGVAVSTTGNTDPSDFETIAEWTMDQTGGPGSLGDGVWGYYTVDLSNYVDETGYKTGYVAIRHFNCTDQYALVVDEISIVEGPVNVGELTWTTKQNVNSPYILNNLEENSIYDVRVKANYTYNHGASDWVYIGVSTEASDICQTFNVDGYPTYNDPGHWYFIASPLAGEIEPCDVGEMTFSVYDFYRLNPSTAMWENFKAMDENYEPLHPDFTGMVNGRGYLYASGYDVTLRFSGTPIMNASKEVALERGWNLVGNPFAGPAYIDRAYYKMNEAGTDIEAVAEYSTTAIPVCTGVVVRATGDNETVTFTRAPEYSTGNNGGFQLTLTKAVARGAAFQDKAIVSFSEDARLGKYIFNEDHAKLFIPQDFEALFLLPLKNLRAQMSKFVQSLVSH